VPVLTGRDPIVIDVRPMVRRYLRDVLTIEDVSFDFPRDEDWFLRRLHGRAIGHVALHEKYVVGFMLYNLPATEIALLDLAVDPAFRRRGVGRQLIDQLKWRLSPIRRRRVVLAVRETGLAAQLFLRRQGFRAVAVERGRFADTGEDGYVMECRADGDGEPAGAGDGAGCRGRRA
jgi:[ribosomal protein S18]-alanine N-acetyltransferase